jgi:hypothetical protein
VREAVKPAGDREGTDASRCRIGVFIIAGLSHRLSESRLIVTIPENVLQHNAEGFRPILHAKKAIFKA